MMTRHHLLLFLLAGCAMRSMAVTRNACSAKACVSKETEVERWQCLGEHLFGPADGKNFNGRFVEHNCGHVGLGTNLLSLSISAQLAGILDAKLIFPDHFLKLWNLPRTYQVDDDYGRERWNYEMHGRGENSFRKWANMLDVNTTALAGFNNKILDPGICGVSANIIRDGPCMTDALKTFKSCIGDLHDFNLNMPVFYIMFQRPNDLMVSRLEAVREQLSLPQLPPGMEPNPGAWGLYTPGYYLFALHFRMIPLGFEPLSVMLNDKSNLAARAKLLDSFWKRAEQAAAQARELADCRNETLLIYFATDDPANLREVAAARLRRHGRVVFGLDEGDVGHSVPKWTPSSEANVDSEKDKIRREYGDGAAEPAGTCKRDRAGLVRAKGDLHLADPGRDVESTLRHAEMAMVEWWILANAQVS
jgi:hypothetical protein